ncbi:RNA polymerase sigma-70 factor [Carboxylicivirga mesophila]|uniref:RNA polymerase sigma-70 factor n=1 Tax=Carboxylicivirga mesophila TaxID=1166478 RepID=A0ABS5K4P9_9BACT|nr:RNA polymerase sigma-70 factor [Carboxylicivirga mesophila]MBS2209942.1 RNA polymerase sigma-70 factor [Carboxylicivirga mesophila]
MAQDKLSGNTIASRDEFFSQIFERYYVRLCHYAHTFILDFDVCRDLVQELFIKLWQIRLDNFSELEFEKFIFKSIKNACFDYLRKQKVRHNSRTLILERLLEQEEIHISEMEILELSNRIDKVLNNLPEQTARVFRMSRFEDKTNKEIALELDITVKGVEFHMSKALKTFRHELQEYLPLIASIIGIWSNN